MTNEQRAALNEARRAKAERAERRAHLNTQYVFNTEGAFEQGPARNAFCAFSDDEALGRKALFIAAGLMASCATFALSLCFSSTAIAIVVAIVGGLVLGVIAAAAALYAQFAVAPERFEAVGRGIGKALRFVGLGK